jgi:hypothetical protein
MRRGADARNVAQEADVARMVGELVGADQTAERFAAEHRIFVGVDLLEDRALVPHLAFIVFQRVGQLLLGDVHHPDLQLLVGLGVVDEIPEAAPGAFHLAHFGCVQDLVELNRQHLVDACDQRLDRLDRIRRDGGRLGARLGGERQIADELLQLLAVVLLDLEVLFQKVAELTEVDGLGLGDRWALLLLGHGSTPRPCRCPRAPGWRSGPAEARCSAIGRCAFQHRRGRP